MRINEANGVNAQLNYHVILFRGAVAQWLTATSEVKSKRVMAPSSGMAALFTVK